MTLISDEQKEGKTKFCLRMKNVRIYRHCITANNINIVILMQKMYGSGFLQLQVAWGYYLCVAISGPLLGLQECNGKGSCEEGVLFAQSLQRDFLNGEQKYIVCNSVVTGYIRFNGFHVVFH